MNTYKHSDIKVLDELTHIKINPSMYIGDSETPTHLLEELLDNALDECMAGFANIVAIIFNTKEHIYSVCDNGRGIPLDNNVPVVISSKLFSGAKFKGSKTAYEIASGLHGCGLVVVNALSDHYQIEVYRNNSHAIFSFVKGKLKNKSIKPFHEKPPFSTKIEFKPTKNIFENPIPDVDRIRRRLATASAEMNKDIKFILIVNGEKELFNINMTEYFLDHCLKPEEKILMKLIGINSVIKPEKFNITMTYSYESTTPRVLSSVNLLPVDNGGTHVNMFYEILRNYFSTQGKKLGYKFLPNDSLVGLRAILTLSLKETEFSGQSKEKLTNKKSYLQKLVSQLHKNLELFFNKSPDELKILLTHFEEYRTKLDAKKIKPKSNGSRASTKFTKLRDCTISGGELFVVEGDSASGCLGGDTKIKLLDGRNLSIKEIVDEFEKGIDNFVYSYNHLTKRIEVVKIINAKLTKRNTEVYRVYLDNDESFIVTPDHLFMLRNGNYKECGKLKPYQSLMPLYTRIQTIDGSICRVEQPMYESIIQIDKKYGDGLPKIEFVHRLSDEWNLKNKIYDKSSGDHRHHINGDSLNNNPTNIIRKKPADHLSDHWKEFYDSDEDYRKILVKRLDDMQKDYWSNENNKRIQSNKIKEYYEKNPNIIEERRIRSKEQWKDEDLIIWRREETKKQFSDSDMISKKIDTEWRNRLERCLQKIKELGITNYEVFRKLQPKKYMKISTIVKKFFNYNFDEFLSEIELNHKFIKIEKLNHKEDVYDIEVSDNRNFALSCGIFVHNSFIECRDPRKHAVLPLKGKIPNSTTKKDIIKNKEVEELIRSLGTGYGPEFSISNIKFNHIISAVDADPDGSHIFCLTTMVIAMIIPEIIKQGYYYFLETPLYAINEKNIFIPLWSEKEVEEAKRDKRKITRFKGLGELNSDQLKEVAINKNRRLIPVTWTSDLDKMIKLFLKPEEKRKLLEGVW